MERTLLVTLCFDGRPYSGWQVQKNAPTVMETFQNALEMVLRERPDIKGCSRTDAGVHAAMYCVSFVTSRSIPCERLIPALNVHLPRSIAATACREVPSGFHARYDAIGKRYVYRIHNATVRDPFREGLTLHLPRPLDEQLLAQQAQDFVGTHDFAAFQNAGSTVRDTERSIFACDARRDGDLVELSVSGDGFLYNMVRIMVGTLIGIGYGNIACGEIPLILASKDRARAGMTAPACGLTLDQVFYDLP